MTLKIKRFLQTTLALLFCISILLSLGMRVLSVRDNKDYDVLQPELRFPDLISYVLYEESLAQIYVCYNDASYVNVYSEDGTFLWAVSAPYMRNIILMEGMKHIFTMPTKASSSAERKSTWNIL